jgi:Tfp pilus assembly protein PilV
MKNVHRGFLSAASNDDGLTLIEVIAAVIVVVTVALASAGLSINGIKTAAAQERQQVAVTIANGAMETVSGWTETINSSTTVSNLYTGRTSAAVAAAFTANSTQPGVSSTYPTYDPTATGSSTASIPISATSTQNGTSYTTYTLIGDCYEPVAGGACAKISGQPTEPSTTPAGYAQVMRVIVIVSWTAGSSCAASGCRYETTTMEDAHADLQWVTH